MISERNREPDAAEVVQIGVGRQGGLGAWTPAVGPEALELLEHLELPPESAEAGRQRLRDEALRILAQCADPSREQGAETGLAVGYVQSGKTMNFTTVAALARDNGFQVVVVITGTSLNLLTQSTQRLVKDLRLNTRRDRRWQRFENPTIRDRTTILNTLADWNDPDLQPGERKTVLITVLKQHLHLNNLIELLSSLPLQRRPVLVIDDEADQAGLNTAVRSGEESATYRRLLALRRNLPHHSYLQYTATPQAPLLINLIDVLSPRFVELLTPGEDYTGGKEFFQSPGLVRAIPEDEIPSATRELHEPPASLLLALRLFFLGVAAGLVRDGGRGNRSMLVHPSQRTLAHGQYFNWVKAATNRWGQQLELPEGDLDRRDVLEDFAQAYQDLHQTVPDLPPLEELARRLKQAIRQTRVKEINTRSGVAAPEIDWAATYPFILVGGQLMDRGFTVEGLTVTYMPRGLGVGNADNVQQRARFFGYKRQYLGYCRVFLENAARDAYRSYVLHEEDIRGRLEAHRDSGRPLTDWKREFFLNGQLRPTRRSVLGLDYMRISFGEEWWNPGAPYETPEAIEGNRSAVKEFLESLQMHEDPGSPARTLPQRHLLAEGVPLGRVFETLLTKYRVTAPGDSQRFTGLLILIQEHLDSTPDAACSVYWMSKGERRERSVDDNGNILNLFQGPHPDRHGAIYPGDRSIRAGAGVTVQIHNLNVLRDDKLLEPDVPTLAVWIPGDVGEDLVIQDQPVPD